MDREMQARLRTPFPPEAVGKLPKITCKACSDKKCERHKSVTCRTCKAWITTQHMHLDYVGHAHVRERLNDVDPDWNWEPLAFGPDGLPQIDDGCLWIKLTVAGKTMLGVGDAPGKRGGNALKEMIGDALRNAGQSFGIAADLWKKEPVEVPHDTDEPSRQVDRPQQTPEDRASELRGQIRAIGQARGQTVEEIAQDFVEWTRGPSFPNGLEITRAAVATLAEYKHHISRGRP